MGLATSFLAGSKEEWSLVRRHPSESIFGVQLAGNKPSTLVPAAEAIARECGPNVDFVDLNCGCPIDLVFKSGSGSARKSRHRDFQISRFLRCWDWRVCIPPGFPFSFLFHFISSKLSADTVYPILTNRVPLVLNAPGKLGKILIGMNKALGEVPLTVKLRTGVKDGRNTAHKLMPRIASDWGVGCMTVSNICYLVGQLLYGKSPEHSLCPS